MEKYKSIVFFSFLLIAIGFCPSASNALSNHSAWLIYGVTDVNGDGTSDVILWANQTTGEVALWYMNGSSVIHEEKLENTRGPSWHIAGVGDFNRDGSPDLLLRDSATGQIQIQYLKGSIILGEETVAKVSTLWKIVGVADFDGDGSPDILWRYSLNGEVGIWFMKGTTLMDRAAIDALPSPWYVAAVGDFNRDGSPEILWRNSITGEVVEWFMRGTVVKIVPLLAAPTWSSSIDEYTDDSGGLKNPTFSYLFVDILSALLSPAYLSFHTRARIYRNYIRAPPTLSVYS